MSTPQVYLRDLVNHTTIALSRTFVVPTSGPAGGVGRSLSISADGKRIAFLSSGVLTAIPTGGNSQGYVFDANTSTTTMVATNALGTALGANALELSLSHDGNAFAFITSAVGVVPMSPPPGGVAQAYVRDISNLMSLGATVMASVNPTGMVAADADIDMVAVADDRTVAFTSGAGNLVPMMSSNEQVYRRPLGGPTSLVTHVSTSVTLPINAVALVQNPTISADGQTVAYESDSDELNPIGSNMHSQVFVWRAADSSNTPVSVTPAGALGDGDSLRARLSGTGQFVSFASESTDLVPGFVTAPTAQVYVRNLAAAPPVPPTTPTATTTGSGSSALASTGSGADGAISMSVAGAVALLVLGAAVLALYRSRMSRATSRK